MYFGEKPRKGLSKFVAVLTALAIASASLLAVPAYAAESGAENQNPVMEFFGNVAETLGLAPEADEETDGNIQPYAAGDKGIKKSDPSTIDAWNNILQEEGQASTQNIGRIWTDKSVFTEDAEFTQGPLAGQPIDVDGDHDFLVGLSALSSTSNLSTTTHTSQPLDIVLVLDDSGSMAYSIDSDTPNQIVYTAVSADQVVESHGHTESGWFGSTSYIQDTRGGEYYVQNDRGGYDRITEVTETHSGDRFEGSYEEHIRWTVNGQTVDPETTQFYTRTEYDLSERRGALQYAVSNFIDQAAAMNAQITDENAKIRLSIVVFASDSSIENHLTVCEGANVAELKGTLNDLSANGATNAGAGMTSANNELRQNSNRDNTKQIVIFFTDGVPTTQSSFATGVANTAVVQAGAIKDRGGSVYSIGIFDGADPSQTTLPDWYVDDTDRANVFMNAVSSNYPNSTAWNNLGQRATGNPDFYKSADNAGSLNEVFQDIFDESTEGATSGSPIEGTDVEGVQDAVPGTLTFTDTLGDYMEITGNTMTLVYGGQQYSATKGGDGVYRFPGQTVEGNDIYKSAKLSDITISIQKGEGSAGDTVTVSMPASFIPLRNYTVTTVDGKTEMSVTDAYPIRLFYGVSVKQDVLDNLGDPSNTTLQDYINKNKTGGGSVNFYANKWSGEQFGDTTATFTPNEGNKFYYYTDNTELYIDESCNTRATRRNISGQDTLYYKDTYWVQNGTSGSEETEVVAISVSGQDAQGLEYDRNNNAYIAAGTQRYDRPAGLASDKDENTTSTATDVLNPTWSNGTTVSQRLGNNGVIPVELPAQLSVTKTVDFGGDYGDAFDETVYTNKSYEMNIHVDDAQGTYKAQVKNAEGDVVSQPTDGYFNITFDQNGDATHSIKADETLTIYGLDGAATYEVTEITANLGNGFSTPSYTNNEGTLTANGTSSVTVANTYTLNPVTGKGEEIFHGSKTLDGRDWENGTDVFTFQLSATGGAPMPADAQGASSYQITVDAPTEDASNSASFSFGDVEYTKPGVYTYNIEEIPPANARPGMSYSNAAYTVEVTVTDNQNGQMVVTSKMIQTRADNIGDPVAGELKDKVAAFTNHFTESETTAVLGATKDYDNQSGNPAMNLADDMFSIEMRPIGDNAADAPMPESGVTGEGANRVATVSNDMRSFRFPRITFTNQMDGETFTYQINEVKGNVNNMKYDEAVYTVKVTVHVDEQNQVSVVTEYFDVKGTSLGAGEGDSATRPEFHNTYNPSDATLTEDGGNALRGEKTLTGRDMLQDESFGFTLSPRGNTTQTAVTNGDIAIADNDWAASVSGGKNGQAEGFTFGDMTFKKAGTYTFNVRETSHNGKVLPTDGTDGVTYDHDTCIVTVTVTDENGVLTPTVSYNNGQGQLTDRAVFQNNYASSVEFGNTEGGINITKQLNGRNMTADEFQFAIKAVDAEGAVSATDADAKLADADRTFSNPTGAMAGVASQSWKQLAGVTFNQNDAGKTFVYEVSETTPATDTVATDGTVYTVTLTPQDNNDGSMYVTGSVKGGDLDITIDTRDESYAAPVLPFVNTYTPKPVSTDDNAGTTLQVTKKVTGANAAGTFNFELALDATNSDNGADGVFEDADAKQAFDGMTATTKENLAKDETETLSFGQLTFTKAGTYTFKVKETTTAPADYWTYDNAEHTITVEVSDNNGQLEILYARDNNPTVENKYTAGSVVVGGEGAEQQIVVKKTVTGHASTADFSFKLEPADFNAEDPESVAKWSTVDPVEENYKGVETIAAGITEDGNNTATFGGIKFSAAGEFKFKVTEVEAHDGENDPAGWTYDAHESFVTVTVTDDGRGQLKAAVTYDNAKATTDTDKGTTDAAAFTNSYKASGSLDGDANSNLTVTKNYTSDLGDPWTPDDSFGFWLEADTSNADTKTAVDNGWIDLPDNAGSADAAGISITDESADHQASFGDIAFSHAGTFQFKVHEVLPEGVTAESPTKDGITYDTSTKVVTVNVEDDDAGKLTASVADGSDELTFNNTYSVGQVMFRAAYFKLQGNKVLDGRTWEQGDEFTFTLTAGVSEINGEKVQPNDPRVLDTMPAKTTDTINPLADGSVDNGGSIVDNNSAQFTFTDERWTSGTTVPEDQFTFSVPGTYRYLIQETNPNQAKPGSGILGVTYDQTTYRLEVIVVNNGDGTLKVDSYSYSKRAPGEADFTQIADSSAVTFTNVYNTESIGVTFNAAKVLEGRKTAMADNEFQFHMEFAGWKTNDAFDADPASTEGWQTEGDVAAAAPKAAADANNIIRGDVTFADVTFTKDHVGNTYRYAITEVIPADATNEAFDGVAYGEANADQKAAAGWEKDGITYDGSTKYVTARVTTEEKGDQSDPDATVESIVRVQTAGEASLNDGATDTTGTFSGGAIFTNTYDADDTTGDTGTAEDGVQLTKVLKGKAWDGDTFTFQIAPVSNTAGIEVDNMPMPDKAQVDVSAANGKDADGNDQATFSFGSITFDTEGTYVYKVTEVKGDNAGITYDTANKATVTITVTDNNNGTMSAGVSITNNVFTNEYASELDYAAAGGLEIVKTFENADMQEFTFKVTPNDQVSADKLGIDLAGETFKTKSGATVGDDNASHAEVMVLDAATERMFTQDDAGDTYTYTVEEVPGTDDSVSYDQTKYTVTIETADDGLGGIEVTTTVSNGAGYNQSYVYDNDEQAEDPTAIVPFTNTYKATGQLGGDGDVSINATKTLTNRPMVDGEFAFNVTNVNDDAGTAVATGTNDANGNISFSAIDYSIDQMLVDADNGLAASSEVNGKDAFTYTYQVTEDTANLDKGVSAIDVAGFQVEVTVIDNGDGTLGFDVAYPGDADGLTFRNTYGEGETGQETIHINGVKGYKHIGLDNAPDINGKFTFELIGVDEEGNPAPMPATTTATNDKGNVDFGDITYTMENVFGDTGSQAAATNAEDEENGIATQSVERTKTFTYTVTESGHVDGVDNDPNSTDTFTVTVTDHGDGRLTVETSPNQDHGLALFGFTNEYNVDPVTSSPTADGSLTITKELIGRALAEGEFTAVMVDGKGAQVSQGVNDVNGNIALDAITFNMPGDYTYDLYEAPGSKGGVTYDAARYKATAHVVDNGNGTMSVTWEFANASGDAIDAIAFSNTYEAAPTSVLLGGSKVLDGRDLAEGEFEFQLSDKDGNVLQTVSNAADGGFCFDSIAYDQAGTYEYTISEVAGDVEGVTYDDATYAVKVVVTDDGQGKLQATTITYNGEAALPVFHNTYTKPAEPPAPKPEEPKPEVIPATGDAAAAAVMATAGIGAALAAAGYVTSKKRGE